MTFCNDSQADAFCDSILSKSESKRGKHQIRREIDHFQKRNYQIKFFRTHNTSHTDFCSIL